MQILPVTLQRGVLLSVKLPDGRLAFWSERQNIWTTSYEEATVFQTEASALQELTSGRKKMEAGFLKRTNSDFPLLDG